MQEPLPEPISATRLLFLLISASTLAGCAIGGKSPTVAPQLTTATPAVLGGSCDSLLSRLSQLPSTKITSASLVAEGELRAGNKPIPAHCLVKGSVNDRLGEPDQTPYAMGFEMRLPLNWNGRFWYQANGGIDGSVEPARGEFGGGALTGALAQGFVVISSDAGHDNKKTRGPGFGFDPQARLDYGYNTVGTLAPIAKDAIRLAYGKGPDRSYIGGCSNGGRHTLVAAARFPEMFDGYLAGAPGYNLPLAAIASIFGAQQYATVATNPKDLSTAFTRPERQTVVNAVLAKCDALDGARDGMIQDTGACQAKFDFMADVPTCAAERTGNCLSTAQKKAIAPIFSGAVTRDGKPFYASFPIDAGLAGDGVANWEFTAPIQRDASAVAFIWAVPPQAAKGFDDARFALGTPVDQMLAMVNTKDATFKQSGMEFMTPPNAGDTSKVNARGGKILVFHGVSDSIFSVNDTESWLKSVQKNSGGDASNHARLFRVPGMDHCRGGAATDQFDPVTPLVKWVEQGIAPERIVASARSKGNPGGENKDIPADWLATRTRPLCAYPTVATYGGTGSLEDEASFKCK